MNLHELLITPGSQLPFRQELNIERLDFPSFLGYSELPVGDGTIVNSAGAKLFSARGSHSPFA